MRRSSTAMASDHKRLAAARKALAKLLAEHPDREDLTDYSDF